MPKLSLAANAAPMPEIDRRAAFGALAAAGALLAAPKIARAAVGDDAELIALERRIRQIHAEVAIIERDRIDPHREGFRRALFFSPPGLTNDERWARAKAFSVASGVEAAEDECEALYGQADKLLDRLLNIPATTPAGRAAKIRTYLVAVLPKAWTTSDDWDIEKTLDLFAELAGVTRQDLDIPERRLQLAGEA